MAFYPDGTMDVNVDGKIERRSYRIQHELATISPTHRTGRDTMTAIPYLRSNERVADIMGSQIPVIYKVSEPC